MSSTELTEDGRAQITYGGREYVFDVFEDPLAATLWELMEESNRLQRDYGWICEQNLASPTNTGKLSAILVGGKIDGMREVLDRIVQVIAEPYLKAGDAAM